MPFNGSTSFPGSVALFHFICALSENFAINFKIKITFSCGLLEIFFLLLFLVKCREFLAQETHANIENEIYYKSDLGKQAVIKLQVQSILTTQT